MTERSTAREEPAKRAYSAPAVEKAFDVMELLADTPGGLSISEIAARLGRSLGELFRIVIVMERRGYLEKNADNDRYTIAYKVLDLAYRATPAQHLIRTAAPIMHVLAREIEQSCHLVVPDGGNGLVIMREENPGPRGFAVKLGARIDLVRSCSGHVILAFSGSEERERMLDQLPSEARSKLDPAALSAALETVRRRGYDSRPSPITQGVTDISFPVFGFGERLLAAVTVPFLELIDGSQLANISDARDKLAETAKAISLGLGWHERSGDPPLPEAVANRRHRRGRRTS